MSTNTKLAEALPEHHVPIGLLGAHHHLLHAAWAYAEEYARKAMSKQAAIEFPKPRQQETPCPECHLQPGERCDICGAPAAPAPEAQDSARTSPAHQPVHGWTDADADAARLALELECILLDPDTPMPLASRWWGSAHEALALHRQRLASEQSHGMNRRMAALKESLAAHESAAEPARLTDEQRIDWLCEEAVYHCGQWQVVFDSDKDSFIDAIDEMAAIAHGIGATTGGQQR